MAWQDDLLRQLAATPRERWGGRLFGVQTDRGLSVYSRYSCRFTVDVGPIAKDGSWRFYPTVNDRPVGPIPAGCLLVIDFGCDPETGMQKMLATVSDFPWNERPDPDGGFLPLLDAEGKPPFPSADLDAIPSARPRPLL